MENKKSFGLFIQQKRKEAGLTQKELADTLYLSESAVSKWERGLSYPDITLIKDICEALRISDHELLTASEDLTTRANEKLAAKYMKLIRRLTFTQYILYGLAILVCFICNLAVEHTLSWFFIVLTSVMTAASLTLLPVLVEKHRAILTLCGFTGSLLLLLFVCRLLTGGSWFLITAVSVLFGLCVVFLPFVLKGLALPEALSHHKALLCLAADTVLLFLLLFAANWFTGGGWFVGTALPVTAFWLLLPWGMLLLIRYARMNGFFKAGACLGLTSLVYCLSFRLMTFILGGEGYWRFGTSFDFRRWNGETANGNVNMLIFFVLLGLAILFTAAGVIAALRKERKRA